MSTVEQTAVVRCRWLTEGKFLLRSDEKPIDAVTLKAWLFGWHAPSFYGTALQVVETNGKQEIALPADQAVGYFAEDVFLAHSRLRWGEEVELLKQAARIYQDALANGHFAPDYDRWLSGQWGWKLTPAITDSPAYRKLRNEADRLDIAYLDEWFDRAVAALCSENAAVREAWSQIAAACPLLPEQPNAPVYLPENAHLRWPDEEEWWIAIGWRKDEVPFRTLLQLSEPENHSDWRLRLVLQDIENPELLVECRLDAPDSPIGPGGPESPEDRENPVGQYGLKTPGLVVRPVEGTIPGHWQPHVLTKVRKDAANWLRSVPWLENPASPGLPLDELTDEQAWAFLTEGSLRIMEAGYSVRLPAWWDDVRRLKPRLKAKIRSSVGSSGNPLLGLEQIVQFDWRLAIGDLDLSEAEFAELVRRNQRLVQVRGRWIQLDPAMLQQIRRTMNQVSKSGLSFRDVLELHLLGQEPAKTEADDAPAYEAAARMEVELNEHLTAMFEQLHHAAQLPILAPPAGFQGTLRKYQAEGFSWLTFLRRFGLGGCLADDMGLGKTIQWIAYLLYTRATEPALAPALLICPTSVLGNWQKELQRFAPSLRVHLHYGANRGKGEQFVAAAAEADLVITSYTLAQMDEDDLSAVQWDCLCLDEAQNIKNVYTKQSAAIRRLKAGHRIALTGTPIENRLTELWTIFDFINPGYLGSLAEFQRKYVHAIEKANDAESLGRLQKLVRPFLLRRTKKDPSIQLDLPDKNEAKIYVPLTVEQGAIYESVVRDLFDKLDGLTGMERRGLILSTLIKLKQLCNHPALLQKEAQTKVTANRSNKIVRMLEMIRELRDEGDRCLIFTQFVEMGHMLQEILEGELGEPVQFLHGGVPKAKRDQMVARFQDTSLPPEQQCGIFLLSLKAGGTGLNLTAANHVFHFDRWWNPAVENQATDRAFRIGQTRDVQVHKFITLGTLEERIDEMIERKQGLSEQIVGHGENWITELSTSELKELFALRKKWIGE
jgi:SNF2 family DNA or RNA helicase